MGGGLMRAPWRWLHAAAAAAAAADCLDARLVIPLRPSHLLLKEAVDATKITTAFSAQRAAGAQRSTSALAC
jgi:hypothetical protein